MKRNEPSLSLINLAFQVENLETVEAFIEQTTGWEKISSHLLDGEMFLEAFFGGTTFNFFTKPIYADMHNQHSVGYLHTTYRVSNIDYFLENEAWSKSLFWGPEIINGTFGKRKIAFFNSIEVLRIELFQEIS